MQSGTSENLLIEEVEAPGQLLSNSNNSDGQAPLLPVHQDLTDLITKATQIKEDLGKYNYEQNLLKNTELYYLIHTLKKNGKLEKNLRLYDLISQINTLIDEILVPHGNNEDLEEKITRYIQLTIALIRTLNPLT